MHHKLAKVTLGSIQNGERLWEASLWVRTVNELEELNARSEGSLRAELTGGLSVCLSAGCDVGESSRERPDTERPGITAEAEAEELIHGVRQKHFESAGG